MRQMFVMWMLSSVHLFIVGNSVVVRFFIAKAHRMADDHNRMIMSIMAIEMIGTAMALLVRIMMVVVIKLCLGR